MQLISSNDDGDPIILYDSRWRDPSVLGYKPDDPQYRMLQELYEAITGKNVNSQAQSRAKKENAQ